jgi:hypothetical protein
MKKDRAMPVLFWKRGTDHLSGVQSKGDDGI